jgi:hypothetical protein
VIGIDVLAASHVSIRRVRLRGFSLSPGIVTVRSSFDVEIASSLIHASCTQSTELPADIASFQITGISVDDTRVRETGSRNVTLRNNVIADLRMVPLTTRQEQSDGINFAAVGTGAGSTIVDNDISGVDEGIDLFGRGIVVRGNRVAAHSVALKLIHGAREIVAVDNQLTPGPNGRAIGLFGAAPEQAQRQVRDVRIERNVMDLSAGSRAGVHVDADRSYSPQAIELRQNVFIVRDCKQVAMACTKSQCTTSGNRTLSSQTRAACPE